MPKYVTTEPMYQCNGCDLVCAVRELERSDSSLQYCPRCGLFAPLIEMERIEWHENLNTFVAVRGSRALTSVDGLSWSEIRNQEAML